MLEIRNGGFAQADLFNRVLVNNIHRIHKCLNEHSNTYNQQINNLSNCEQTEINRPHISISSFFPFTSNTGNSVELNDVLTTSSGLLVEGSLYDTASMSFQYND